MAGISTSIELQDRMSGALNRITASLYNTTAAFQGVDRASETAFDTASVQAITQEMYSYEQRIQQLENDLISANNQIERMQEETEQARQQAAGLESMFRKVGSAIAAIGIGAMVKEAIDYASDLQEVQNVVDVTFGQGSAVNEWSQTTLEAFGLNELSAKKFSGTMGAMLKSSGLSGEAVEDMSMKITELSGDMASFYNLDSEEAFNKIRSGISGETEPLKQLGINMSVANLEAFAMSQGIEKAYQEMSQAEQVTLRYNYLLAATGDAQGDFARTSDSYANQVKLLKENWKSFTGELATNALPILAQGIQILNSGITALSENWSIISPILTGLITIVGLYTAALGAYNIAKGISTAIEAAHTLATKTNAAAQMMQSGATFMATAAQHGFNAALLACPLTWILLIIIAVIAAIYGIVAAINKVTGSTYSATGIIVGALTAAVAFIWNLFLGLLDLVLGIINVFVNKWIIFANFFANLFNDPIGSVIHLFGDMADAVLGVLESIAKAMDKIFGSNMADTVSGWRSGLDAMVEKTANKYGNGSYEKVLEEVNLSSESLGLERWAYGDAWDAGVTLGEGIDDKMSSIFGGSDAGEDASQTAIESALGGIGNDTSKIADSVDISNENLEYMRDLAEQEAINRFTTAEVKVELGGVTNNVNQNTDLDGFVTYLSDNLSETLYTTAEGVHS